MQDSTRYASVLQERERAEAKRDTVLRSLNLIRAIDDDRFIWPHVMDEVSRALPPYTWLVSLGFTGAGRAQQAVDHDRRGAPAEPGKKKRKHGADGRCRATRCASASSATPSTSRRSRAS